MERSRGRLWAALLIAAVGIIMYMSQTQENPVTGEKQHVTLTTDQEIKLGLASAPEMAKQMGGVVPENDPRAEEVNRIGELLVNKSQALKSPWQFQFHLLEDPDTVNAFALPGGQIFITLGLYDKLQNEAQLAGVLAHEMGHVFERHSAEQMATGQLGNILIIAVATGASDGGSSTTPAMVAAAVNQMFQLSYSRKDESEADQWGLKIMSDAGFTPTAMIGVMKILKAAGGGAGGRGPDFFQSHPHPDLRIEQIQEYLKEHPEKPGLTEGRPLVQVQAERKSYFFERN